MSELYPTHIPGCHLRFATEKDLYVILDFIRELAKYEKLLDQVEADEQMLADNLFGDKPFAEVILAIYNNQSVGFALFFHTFSTFLGKPGIYLEDLFVIPDFRGKGIGKSLLTLLATLAIKRDCGRLEWSVLDWNQPAIDFYHSLGAKPLDEWTTFRLSGDSLFKLAENLDEKSRS